MCMLLCGALKSYGQKPIRGHFESMITTSVFAPTISYAPRWNLGYIRRINEHYWLGVDLGYGSQNTAVNFAEDGDWITQDYKLYEIRPEVYYDLRPQSKLKHLVSAELFYIHHTDQFSNSWLFELDENKHYKYDRADYKRRKYGVNFNYSLLYNITENLALMQKIGVGFRIRNVAYTNIINKSEDPYYEGSEGFLIPSTDGYLKDNGAQLGFNFNLDFKLIYKF